MYPDDLTDKIAIVTGAAGGMGRAITRSFADAGCHVVAADLANAADDLLAECSDLAGTVIYRSVDVSQADDVQAMVQAAVDTFGGLDCAVNAAAIEFETVSLADCEDDDFDTMMAVNTRGVFLSMKHEIRAMIASGAGGAIVNIASTNSFRPQHHQPAYTASKHAVLGLTRSAAIDYARHDIRINCVVPGAINTPMLHNAVQRRNRDIDEVAGRLSQLGRFGEPEEIANACLWLCSAASSFTTGHALSVDGGMLAG